MLGKYIKINWRNRTVTVFVFCSPSTTRGTLKQMARARLAAAERTLR